MTEEERERQLAGALAKYLDENATTQEIPPDELRADVELLAEMDRLLEPDASVPERLSRHKILGKIGAGGMGRVFLAFDEALGRKIAIKTLNARYAANPVLRARFMREARAMAQLNHPHIVRIYSLGPDDEMPHFVMEHIEGAPLTAAAAKLDIRRKAELIHRVVLAVSFLHEHGVIHRDLKPGNILVGADLEPKLLDFGLALEVEAGTQRLSLAGEVVGTPEYLSPEQTRAATLDARTDIYSIGAVLYELLTGSPPFRGETLSDLLRRIRDEDPVLPRRHEGTIPRDLQNICLKALEKEPARRYQTARDMAEDLARFLAGEPALAAPGAYSRLISDRVAQHVAELDAWRRDEIISDAEYDGLRKRYGSLADREDAWIMEARRLTFPQVSLYLGAWLLAIGAAIVTAFRFSQFPGASAVLAVFAAVVPTAWIGVRSWNAGRYRIAIAYLLGSCLLLPLMWIVSMVEAGISTGFTQGRQDLELFAKLEFEKQTTNSQIWWALLLSMPAALWLRRFTRSSVFSLISAALLAVFCLATLLRLGMLEWLEQDPGSFYLHLLPCGVLFMAIGVWLEHRRQQDDSRYFYPFAVAFTYISLTGIALFHDPWARTLEHFAPWTRGQLEYLFILNALIYLVLDTACQKLASPQTRIVGKAFRFVIPGHILTSLLLLGIHASIHANRHTEHLVFLWLLPVASCAIVFFSIPKQMKNFFGTGLLFLAIGAWRLQKHVFAGEGIWPVALLIAGFALMLAAANYAALKIAVLQKLGSRK